MWLGREGEGTLNYNGIEVGDILNILLTPVTDMNLKLTNLGSLTNKYISPPPLFLLKCFSLLRAFCLMLEMNEFGCYEAKIEESEKASSRRESNPGHPLA